MKKRMHLLNCFVFMLFCGDTLIYFSRLKECGENMLMDISELLFNELVFLRAMQQSGSRYEIGLLEIHFL